MTSLRIAAAELRSAGGALALLVALVALTAGVAVAAPQTVARASSLELARGLTELPEERRNPSGQLTDLSVLALSPFFEAPPASVDVVYGPLQRALDAHRLDQPEPLRSALGDADIVVIGEPIIVVPADPLEADPRFLIRGVADPAWEDRLSLVEGRLPEPWDLSDTPEPSGVTLNGVPVDVFRPPPVEIALTAQGAAALRWTVGEQRLDAESTIPYLLVGLVDPIDVDSAYWRGIPAAPEAERFDDGNQQPRETAAAFVHPLTVGSPLASGPISVQYPFDTSRIDATTVDVVLPQLRAFVAGALRIPFDGVLGSGTAELTLVSAVPGAADAVLARVGVTQAILALTVAGPLGALSVVLLLAARAAVERRRPVLALRLARGASRARVRAGVVAGTLALTAPGALVGVALGLVGAVVLVGASPSTALAGLASPGLLAVLAVVVLAPGLVLAALVPRAGDIRERRSDLARPGAARSLVDLVVIALAALSVWFVLQRGVVAAADAVGIDPILVAMPLLVALAVGALVVRAYPALLGLLQAVGAAGRGAAATIGLRRASRDRAVGPVIAIATLLATAVAVSSVTLLVAVDDGLERAARDELGAAVRATGPGATAELAVAAADLPEAGIVGGIESAGPAVLNLEGVRENATLFIVDAGAVALRDDLPAGFGSSAAPADVPVPVVMSADLLTDVAENGGLPAPGADYSVAGVDVSVVALSRPSAGYGTSSSWVLVSAVDVERFATALGTDALTIDTVLVDPAPGATSEAVAAALAGLAADRDAGEVRVAIAAELAAADRAAPLTAALRTALLAGAALAGLLGIAALAIAAVVGRPRRQRVQALAQVLGVAGARSLVAWELGPPAIVGIVSGTLVGTILVPLSAAAADLRFVTGQAEAVSPVLDPALIAATSGAVSLAALVIVGLATALDRTPPLLSALRTETS